MMAVLKFEVMAKNGSYKDRNGNDKVRWHKMGNCFETEKGLSIKIDSTPVGWDGWISLFEPRPKENFKEAGSSDVPRPLQEIAEDIPF